MTQKWPELLRVGSWIAPEVDTTAEDCLHTMEVLRGSAFDFSALPQKTRIAIKERWDDRGQRVFWSHRLDESFEVMSISGHRIMALIGGVIDDYLRVRTDAQIDAQHFFAITTRLPVELQEWIVFMLHDAANLREWTIKTFLVGGVAHALDALDAGGRRFMRILHKVDNIYLIEKILSCLPKPRWRPMALTPSRNTIARMLVTKN